MVQDADGQNCRYRLICRLNISSESASATACGRAFQAGMVRGRNAYLNASTVGWKRWNCLGWPLAEFCGRGTGWYSCGTSTSPFVILYVMVSLLWSLRDCKDNEYWLVITSSWWGTKGYWSERCETPFSWTQRTGIFLSVYVRIKALILSQAAR